VLSACVWAEKSQFLLSFFIFFEFASYYFFIDSLKLSKQQKNSIKFKDNVETKIDDNNNNN